MGCVMSKKAAPVTPALDSSGASWEAQGAGEGAVVSLWDRIKVGSESGESARVSSRCGSSKSFRLGNFHKQVEAEQVAAGWPAWLSAVSGEAIKGWVPLKADSFEKLEKKCRSSPLVVHGLDLGLNYTSHLIGVFKFRYEFWLQNHHKLKKLSE